VVGIGSGAGESGRAGVRPWSNVKVAKNAK